MIIIIIIIIININVLSDPQSCFKNGNFMMYFKLLNSECIKKPFKHSGRYDVTTTGSNSHLVLLPLQSLHVVELLRLQLAHPFMQLIDLIPAGGTTGKIHNRQTNKQTNS